MNSDQRVMEFAVETGMYVNIPHVVMLYLNTIRSEISTTALQLYIYYHYLWRKNNNQTRFSVQALAAALQSTPSTIKRANSQLLRAGLITREERSLRTGEGLTMKISSTTRPAIPTGLLAEMQKMPIRKPFSHPEAGEIGSLSELLERIADDGTAKKLDTVSLCTEIIGRLNSMIESGDLVAEPEKVASLAREVTWSIYEGQLGQSVGFQSESHMVNAAINLIKRREWKRPRGYPQGYLEGWSSADRNKNLSEDITF
jgi:hypothetical protein